MSAAQIYASALVNPGNASISLTANGVEYFAEAPRFSDPTAAAWRCWAVFPIAGNTGRRIKHAEGLHAPGASGENLSGLTYA